MPSGTLYRYMDFLRQSHTRYRIHSPFIYRLTEEVLRRRAPFEGRREIESLRKKMKADQREIMRTDLGAGSAGSDRVTYPEKISKIASNSALPPFRALQLYNLSRFLQASRIIELGTSLGITASYLARSMDHGKLYTVEGCPGTAAIAQDNFIQLGLENVELVTKPFDEALPGILDRMECFDLAFLDGNHAYGPTLRYFAELAGKKHNDSVIVIDDINWSDDMARAWNVVCRHPDVRVIVDLYRMGLVFFRKELSRQHFRLRY